MAEMEGRDKIIAKVKALWAKGDDPACTPEEATAFRDKAAELMAKYEIEQFVLAESEGKEPAIVLGLFRIDTFDESGKSKMILSDERMLLAGAIARHFECKGVVKHNYYPTADAQTGRPLEPGLFYECIGYEHDFAMVRELYFNLVVDLLAGVYSEVQTNRNYQQEYARGFIDRIDRRLGEFYQRVKDFDDTQVSSSVAIAIRSRLAKVQDKFNEMYPPGSLSKAKVKSTRYDPNARSRGKDRADRADIGGVKLTGGNSGSIGAARKEIGS